MHNMPYLGHGQARAYPTFQAYSPAASPTPVTSSRFSSSAAQFKTNKVIYRRYAGLYFSLCVDVTDNELAYLESIHLFVEILDHYFSNVCELDLVFNFHKVSPCRCPSNHLLSSRPHWGRQASPVHTWVQRLWELLQHLTCIVAGGHPGVPHPGRVYHGRRDPRDQQKGGNLTTVNVCIMQAQLF